MSGAEAQIWRDRGLSEDRAMVLSFAYVAFVFAAELLLRGGWRAEVKDIELLVLRHQLEILRVRSSA